MKYKLIRLPPPVASTFEEFAEKFQLELVVTQLRPQDDSDRSLYRAQFRDVEVKCFGAKPSNHDYSEGATIHEAVTKYFARIAGCTVLIGGEEVFVPKGLRHSSELEICESW